MTRIALPLLFYDMAKVHLEYARDMQDLIAEEGEARPLKAKAVDRAVTCYASVSAAVPAYFGALITEEVARGKGRPSAEGTLSDTPTRQYANTTDTNANFGKDLAMGDVDQDGLADLLIGAWAWDGPRGGPSGGAFRLSLIHI